MHIDDVVAAHILAMEESKASGRLVCSSSVAHWSEIIETLRNKYPAYNYINRQEKHFILFCPVFPLMELAFVICFDFTL